MMRDVDIVEDIFARVREILGDRFAGEISVKLAEEEDRVRQAWGGTEPYVAKRRDRGCIKKMAMDKLNHGAPIQAVVNETGISRAGIYRLLKRK